MLCSVNRSCTFRGRGSDWAAAWVETPELPVGAEVAEDTAATLELDAEAVEEPVATLASELDISDCFLLVGE